MYFNEIVGFKFVYIKQVNFMIHVWVFFIRESLADILFDMWHKLTW